MPMRVSILILELSIAARLMDPYSWWRDRSTRPVVLILRRQSDPGPLQSRGNAPIRGGASSDGDRHVLVSIETIGSCTVVRGAPRKMDELERRRGAISIEVMLCV